MNSVGDYTLLSVLGEGGMGIVHLARHEPTGQRVALKVLRPQIVGDDEGRQRLEREVGSLQRVRSRWVAEIIDADPWGPVPYVVMRYVPGRSLHDEIAHEGPIVGRDLRWLARCLIDALAAVHAGGVLHRDVKPSNVIMEGRTPVLIDFGLARVADDPKITHTGWLLGTPGYLPPEILRGEDASPASDVHSWAATVAFAVTGRPPYGRGPSAAIMDRARRGEHDLLGIEPGLRAVLEAALSPDPQQRPTVAQLQQWFRDPTRPLAAPEPVSVGAAWEDEEMPSTTPLGWHGGDAHVRGAGGDDTRIEQTLLEGYPTLVEGSPTLLEPPHESRVLRLRRTVLWLLLILLASAALTAAPVPALAVIIALVTLMRGLSLAGSVHESRREARGARWHDKPRLVIGTPWHLLRSLPSTVVLVLWAGGLALAAGLICYAVAAATTTTLFVCGLVLTVMLAAGPGASRVRGPLRRLTTPVARYPGVWALAAVVLAVLTVALVLRVSGHGTDWMPWDRSPFGAAL